MKPKYILLLLVVFHGNLCVAQHIDKTIKSFELWVGMENRITPIDYGKFDETAVTIRREGNSGAPVVNTDLQLSGTAFSLGLAYKISPVNIGVSFEYAFRSDHLYYESADSSGFGKSVKGLIHDYHFRIFRPFQIRKLVLKPGLGFSLMNRGTEYFNNDGSGGTNSDFNINPFDISLGTDIGPISCDVRCYFIDKHRYDRPTHMLLPEIKFTYRFAFKDKQRE